MQIDTLTMARRLGRSTYKLELGNNVNEELPEDVIYVEDNLSTRWHRHVEKHGPKPKAYGRYTGALNMLEEKLCSK